VTLYHSADAASAASKEFDAVFKEKGTPENIPEAKAKKGTALIDVLVENGVVASKSEARRVIEQGGVKVGIRSG